MSLALTSPVKSPLSLLNVVLMTTSEGTQLILPTFLFSQWLLRFFLPVCLPNRLSFIGFSLGGVIIRAALPFLDDFSEKMHTFISLSSPHLGFLYNGNKIIDAGIWFLKQLRKSQCLKQLTMADGPDDNISNTFLYKLSKQPGLNWFKHICLVSSYQDTYSPFDSARIEMTREALKDAE